MKKWLVAIVLLVAMMVAPAVADASTTPTVKKLTATVQMKSDAAASAKNVLKLSKNSLVIVTGMKNNYSKVNYKGKVGYIATSNLANTAASPKIVSRTQGLVVKGAPTGSAKTVTTLGAKTIVEDYGKVDSTYHLVQYGSVIGYAHKNAIAATKPSIRYVIGESVQIYASANTKATKRSKLTFGKAVQMHGAVGNWAYVSVGNQKGYIAKSFLSSKKPVQLKGTKVSYASVENDIRYTATLRDAKGNSVLAHFIATSDYFKYATWDDVWAGIDEMDRLYIGNFKLALQLEGSASVYMQSATFNSYTYNQSRQMVYKIKGKTTKDTDFIAVAETWSSAGEGANMYYYTNGALKHAGELGYILRPKSIGNQRYQSAAYARDEYTGYIFHTYSFNAATNKWTDIKSYPFFDDKWDIGAAHAEKFTTLENYYVK